MERDGEMVLEDTQCRNEVIPYEIHRELRTGNTLRDSIVNRIKENVWAVNRSY